MPAPGLRLRPAYATRSAFSLIEMLVVIAVIGILATIVIASIYRVKERALGVKSTANFRQTFNYIQLYGNDNQGDIIPAESIIYGNIYGWGKAMEWNNILEQCGYVQNDEDSVFYVAELLHYYEGLGYDFEGRKLAMARNGEVGPALDFENWPNSVQKFSHLEEPSKTMLLTEGQLQADGKWFWISCYSNERWVQPPGYLDGMRYVLYADGHLDKILNTDFPPNGWSNADGRIFWYGY